MHYGASVSEVADCTATTSNCIIYSRATQTGGGCIGTSNCIIYSRATQTGGGCIGSRRAVLAFVLARAGRAMFCKQRSCGIVQCHVIYCAGVRVAPARERSPRMLSIPQV